MTFYKFWHYYLINILRLIILWSLFFWIPILLLISHSFVFLFLGLDEAIEDFKGKTKPFFTFKI